MVRPLLRWSIAAVALLIAAIAVLALMDLNWLRGPISRKVTESTGRAFAIEGRLGLRWAWPPRIRAESVRFANPDWASERQMFTVGTAEVSIDLLRALRGRLYFPEVRLNRPAVFLEQSPDGRKSWLLDREQRDEGSGAGIGRLLVDEGEIGYDASAQRTHIRAAVSTQQDGARISFSAKGAFNGSALSATGQGGGVLSLRDEHEPYALTVDATLGRTAAHADGTVTGLTTFSAADLDVSLQGPSLDALYPIIGVALPTTPAYGTRGHLEHRGKDWRYRDFSAHVGASDVAGNLEIDLAGSRPKLKADVDAKLLDISDLGPLVGASRGGDAAARGRKRDPSHVLPDVPFDSQKWNTTDADVVLRAKTLRKAKELPLEHFEVHLSLIGGKLVLDPLQFGVAGGKLSARVGLDGTKKPILADVSMSVRGLQLDRLLPTVKMSKANVGRIDGLVELKGQGDSVAGMLASSNGKTSLIVDGGEISHMMMELVEIDLWRMLKLKLQGDAPVPLRCAVADLAVKQGVASINTLVLDTEDTTVTGSGSVDLAHERIDLTLLPMPASPVSLRSPIYVRGPLGKPSVGPDKTSIALRGAGALALGALNPLLAIAPLVQSGPGVDSPCGQLIREAEESEKRNVPAPAAPRR